MRSETAVVKKMSKNTHIRIRILLCYGIIVILEGSNYQSTPQVYSYTIHVFPILYDQFLCRNIWNDIMIGNLCSNNLLELSTGHT